MESLSFFAKLPVAINNANYIGALPVRRAHKAEVCTVGRAVQRGAESGEGVRSSPSERSGETAAPQARSRPRRTSERSELPFLNETKGFIKLSQRKASERTAAAATHRRGEKKGGGGGGQRPPQTASAGGAEERSDLLFFLEETTAVAVAS